MVPFAGWEMPIQYPSGILVEHRTVRSGAGLFDISHMGEFRFRGAAAASAVDRLVSSDIAGLSVGQARYGLLCNNEGTIIDDVICYRTAQSEILMVVNASNIAKDSAHIRAHLSDAVQFVDESMTTALLALQGPRAAELLAALVKDSDVTGLPTFGVTSGTVAGVPATITRTGYTGEDGFEIFMDWSQAEIVWRALLAQGSAPIGLGARDTLRLEARFSLYGNEIDETTNPIEAGLGWTCALDTDFLGRDAIRAVKERGPQRRLVGLEVDGAIARHGHAVLSDGAVVGVVTSGTYGPTVQRNIALAYVPTRLAKVGTALHVRVREKAVPAKVVRTPFLRAESSRPQTDRTATGGTP